MSRRTISAEELNVIAKEHAHDFQFSSENPDISRVLVLAFTIVTIFCRRHDPHIKSKRRCQIAQEYLEALLQLLSEENLLKEADRRKFLEEIWNNEAKISEFFESETFLVKKLTMVQGSNRDSTCRCSIC